MGWKSIQKNPNAVSVQEVRRKALRKARAPYLIDDREAYLAMKALGKRVLDVGVVAHTPEAYQSELWLHRHICRTASYCLGCDVLGPELENLKKLGFNVICHDITESPLEDVFDLIILGEIIEHVGRPGDLFLNCARMLHPRGKVILTTPNPWFVTYLLKGLFGGNPLVDSVDHVGWFDPSTLYELADRAGFHLERFTGIRVTRTYSLKAKMAFVLFKFLENHVICREAMAKSVIYEFVKTSDVHA